MEKNVWSESFGFISAPRTKEESAWQDRFIKEVEAETNRGAVLNIVSFIDELLIKLLSSYFPNSKHAQSLLTNMDSCMSSIMDRANVAYALALLRKKEFDAIKILARIRNEFAHKWDGSGFDSEVLSNLIKKLPCEYLQNIGGTNRAKFNCIASNIIQQLLERHRYAKDINNSLPKEYKDFFDLTLEERQKILDKKHDQHNNAFHRTSR